MVTWMCTPGEKLVFSVVSQGGGLGLVGSGASQYPFHLYSYVFLLTREQLSGAQITLTLLPLGEITSCKMVLHVFFHQERILAQTQE